MATKIGRDVTHCQGTVFNLPLKQTYVNPGAGFDNIICAYFETSLEDGTPDTVAAQIIPELIVLYPHTKGVPIQHEQVNINVPVNAQWMGFAILSDAGLWRNNHWNIRRGDRLAMTVNPSDVGNYVTATAQRDFQRTSDSNVTAKTVGANVNTWSNGSAIHMSNPMLNREQFEWFKVDADGSILMEDMAPNTGWDYGVDFTTPLSACARSTHVGCTHD